ncbi:unnamed protein product, partial [Polarella glacialis]
QDSLKGLGCSLSECRREQGADKEVLAKMGSRLEMCHKYFSGLGKGLADAHRQVVSGEGGMLPPKLGDASMLPTLLPMPKVPRTPRTPGTPRGSMPSPRRAQLAGS